MASHIPLVEDDRLIGLDGKPLTPLPVNAWAGLPFEIHPHMRQAEVARRVNPRPLLLVHQNSRGHARIRSGTTVWDVELQPGHVDVFAARFKMDHGQWNCTPGQVLALDIDPQRVHRFLRDDAKAPEPPTALAVRDTVLARLARCIQSEVEAGCASGPLFAEGVSLAVLARLMARADAAPAAGGRRLSPAEVERTVDHIDAHLAGDLSVSALADALDMSAFAFARLFKAALGTTPHRFVLDRRIRRAEVLLAGDLSLTEIAFATGFSSQSHFTDAFRRATGRTPARARRDR